MNDNTNKKVQLWQSLNANIAALEARNPLTVIVMAILCMAALTLGLMMQSVILLYLVPVLAFMVLNMASYGMRKVSVLRGYLQHIEAEINEEMESQTYLWNLKIVNKYCKNSIPGIMVTVLSLIVAVAALGYVVAYLVFLNGGRIFATYNANLIFQIGYVSLLSALAAITIIGFIGSMNASGKIRRMLVKRQEPEEEDPEQVQEVVEEPITEEPAEA